MTDFPVLDGKRLLLVIAGGIAAYKSLVLIRRLREQGVAVRVILTEAGARFVTPLSVAALSEDKVYQDLFSLTDESEMGHIRLSRAADLVVVAPATADLLEPYGLDPALYGEAQGYLVSTRSNVGDMRVYGTEFDYRQNLAFLPQWARGFTVFGNLTMQHLTGNQGAAFSGLFVAKTTNFGVAFSRQRLTLRIAVNQKGRVRQGQITGVNREPGTYQYILPRNSADLTAEYRVTRNFSVFASGRNINEAVDDTVVYGPTTPQDRTLSGRADYRAYWNVGIKGNF